MNSENRLFSEGRDLINFNILGSLIRLQDAFNICAGVLFRNVVVNLVNSSLIESTGIVIILEQQVNTDVFADLAL